MEDATRDRMDDLDRVTQRVLPEEAEAFAIAGATVIVGGKRPSIPNAVVIVRGGRIAEVGPASRVKVPADLNKIDASGMTIVAGLFDMRGQVNQIDWAPVSLASGVTTLRSVGGDSAFLGALRDGMTDTHLIGPRIVSAGFVDGGGPDPLGPLAAATPDDARQAVRKLRGDGYRQADIGATFAPPVLRALAQEARRFGIILTGPVPSGMSSAEAAEAGLDQIEFLPPEAADNSALSAMTAALFKLRTVLDPVLSWAELRQRPLTTPVASFQPGIARAPGAVARQAMSLAAVGPGAVTLAGGLSYVRAAKAAGLAVVAGTNGAVPGFGLARELELLVQAGLTPFEAIQAATSVPAQLLKLDDSGTVEGGKRADLVVLTGNPLENISNIRTTKWVVANGKLYDCAKLWKVAGYGD
jgi:imidazolonepropionase-like amidohydrolase